MTTWRLLDTPPAAGARNMAIDRALFEGVQDGARPVLRFYRWDPPCLSFGRNQPARGQYNEAALNEAGIDIVRRPTGGAAVHHDRELTYAVAVPVGALGSPRETYVRINGALVAGLRRLGVQARAANDGAQAVGPSEEARGGAVGPRAEGLGTGGGHRERPMGDPPPERYLTDSCFRTAAPGEVAAAGRKLVGSAVRVERRTLLQHGSLLLDGDQALATEFASEEPNTSSHPPATLAALLGTIPRWSRLVSALRTGFEQALGIRLAREHLSGAERARIEPHAVHFRSADWTWRR